MLLIKNFFDSHTFRKHLEKDAFIIAPYSYNAFILI